MHARRRPQTSITVLGKGITALGNGLFQRGSISRQRHTGKWVPRLHQRLEDQHSQPEGIMTWHTPDPGKRTALQLWGSVLALPHLTKKTPATSLELETVSIHQSHCTIIGHKQPRSIHVADHATSGMNVGHCPRDVSRHLH